VLQLLLISDVSVFEQLYQTSSVMDLLGNLLWEFSEVHAVSGTLAVVLEY